MALQLNASPETYKEFYGPNVKQMPALVAEGRVPMNVSQLMQRRLDVRNGPQDVKTDWMGNYFDTGDAVAYHPDGRVNLIAPSIPRKYSMADLQTLDKSIEGLEAVVRPKLLEGIRGFRQKL